MEESAVPDLVPVPDDPDLDADECRLWIGNLDKRVTEFSMLKLVQRFGELRKFDFLYNKTGPDIGKPRGYCFVSYLSKKDAEKALQSLNGKLALSKKLLVRWAHQEKTKSISDIKSGGNVESCCQSVDVKIQAIESKLQQMENTQKDFTLSTDIEATPGSSKLSKANPENVRTQIQNKPKPYYKKPRR